AEGAAGATTGSGPAAARGGGNTGTTRAGSGPITASGGGAGGGPSASGGKGSAASGKIGGCANRKAQVPNDPYSPPCIAFSGDNGGATYRGVTPTEITLSARIAGLPDFSAAPSDSGPAAAFSIKPEEIKRTLEGLAEYFNSRFQFYGRTLKVVFFDGKGNFNTEIQGGGQEQVEADAVKAAEEIKAFGDIIAVSAPYSDALARRGLMSFGAPYMSQEWLAARRPYAWSPTTDCTFIQQSVSDYVNKRLAGKPAKYAAGDLKGKPRTTAVIAPENPWYQQCVEAGEKVAKAAGHPNQARIAYKLDFNTLSNQAASIIAKLKSEKITSVICGCDPALPIFLTSKAQEQGYSPEWIITGAGFIDLDILGQLYQQDQWSRSLGLSFIGPLQPLRATTGYNAFKAVRPNEEPSSIVDLLYYNMYLVAIGVQHAGPQLTPETFERGMYAWPGGSGPAGTWKFTPGRYTPTQDAREIYWDRNAVSPQNKEKGSYVETMPGKRFRPGDWPVTDPAVPER
ncbi:MAG: ABC transporter substrate-binding protein, partial [Acidimicrobiia bacterium]